MSVVTRAITAALEHFGISEPVRFEWCYSTSHLEPGDSVGGGVFVCRAGQPVELRTTHGMLNDLLGAPAAEQDLEQHDAPSA